MTNEKVQCPCCKGSGFIEKEGSIPLRHPAEAQMIDIESMDRDALIAEIRRLRGERKGHRKCVLGCGENGKGYMRVSHRSEGECDLRPLYWVSCGYCGHNGPIRMTEDEAWAAWDGVGK